MKLIDVINEIANLPNEDKVNIRGKFLYDCRHAFAVF